VKLAADSASREERKAVDIHVMHPRVGEQVDQGPASRTVATRVAIKGLRSIESPSSCTMDAEPGQPWHLSALYTRRAALTPLGD